MKLDFLVKLYKKLDEINPHVKTLLIMLAFLPVLFFGGKYLLESQQIDLMHNRAVNEQHTMDTAPRINQLINEIQDNVPECSNVLLLTYHNSTNSVSGFGYLYLDCLTETCRAIDDPILQDYWTNLKYVYYCDELQRIHNNGYFMINNIDSAKRTLPRLYRKLVDSEAEAVTFLPLEGIDAPIGMVVILYKEPQPKRPLHTQKVAKILMQLSTLLDPQK